MCSGAEGGVLCGATPGSKRTRAMLDALDAELEELAARRAQRAQHGEGESAEGVQRREEILGGWREQRGQFGRVKGGPGFLGGLGCWC